jgi:hypothetical protein
MIFIIIKFISVPIFKAIIIFTCFMCGIVYSQTN